MAYFGLTQYVNYFRNLATQCHNIHHLPASEDPNYPDKNDCKFALYYYHEVVGGLRSNISDDIVLFLHLYDGQGKDNHAGNQSSSHTCNFIVAKKADINDINEVTQALSLTESTMFLLMNKIIHDANQDGPGCGPLRKVTLDKFRWEPISNLWDGRFGWWVEFSFEVKRTDLMDEAIALDTGTWHNPSFDLSL
jgi:hypothetical protein